MADGSEQTDGTKLPPKLDLRKHAVSAPDDVDANSTPEQESAADPNAPKIKIPGMSDLTAPLEPEAPSSTIRIKMPDEDQAAKPAHRLSLSQPGTAGQGAAKPAIPKPAKPPATPTLEAGKKETSKIPLSAAQPREGGPKTIRIKPRTAAPTVQAKKPAVPSTGLVPSVEEQSSGGDTKEAAKRKTSRISLESALDADAGAAGSGATEGTPKTIRLKRPSEAATVRMKPRPAGDADDTSPKAGLGETARLDELPIEEEERATPTRRRTIKVKRPTQRATVSAGAPADTSMSEEEAAPAVGATLPMYAQQPMQQAPRDGAHWFFVTCACLAVVVGFTLVYMLSAQTFGPNASGTRLSYAPSGPNLSWPGKLTR